MSVYPVSADIYKAAMFALPQGPEVLSSLEVSSLRVSPATVDVSTSDAVVAVRVYMSADSVGAEECIVRFDTRGDSMVLTALPTDEQVLQTVVVIPWESPAGVCVEWYPRCCAR